MSEYSKYWISGYLNGNEPEPPTDSNGDLDFKSLAYKKWTDTTKLFKQTGYWTSEKRNCEKCGMELLNAVPNETCENC